MRVAVVAPRPVASPVEFLPVVAPAAPLDVPRVEDALPGLVRWGLPVAIGLVALVVLGADVGNPPAIVFDEAHYVHWSREIATGRILTDGARVPESPVNYEHPPFAKHLMAGSYRLFHAGALDLTWSQYEKGCAKAETPCAPGRAWEGCDHPNAACRREMAAVRAPSVLAGSLGVVGVYLLGLRLFNAWPAGLFAAALLLLDNLWYLQSRMAMLDVFAPAFAVFGLALALGRGLGARIAGAAFVGLGLASKDTAVFLVPALVVVQYLRTRPGVPSVRALKASVLGAGVPVVVFVASYAPYLARWSKEGVVAAARKLLFVQIAAATWDFGGRFKHDSASAPWSWIPHVNPTFYYWPGYDQFTHDSVLRPPFMYAVGNVALWWPAVLAAVAVPAVVLVRARWRGLRPFLGWDAMRALARGPFAGSPARRLLAACALVWATYVPWFVLRRTMFNYYATFDVPFFALVLGGVLGYAWRRAGWRRGAATATLGFVGLWFTLWWPIVSGAAVSNGWFQAVYGLVPWMSR